MSERSSEKTPERDDPDVIAFELAQEARWEDEGGDGNRAVEPTGPPDGAEARAESDTPEQGSQEAEKKTKP